jgi:hypothetical protein
MDDLSLRWKKGSKPAPMAVLKRVGVKMNQPT